MQDDTPADAVEADVVEPEAAAAVAEIEDFKPSPGTLVITDPGDETGILQVLDRHDELAILNRIQQKATAKLFYSFPRDGKQVTELSVSGVMECIGEMNATGKVNIGIDRDREPRFEIELADTDFAADVEHVVCTVYAYDARTQSGAWGTFSQPRKFKLTDVTKKRREKDKKFAPEDGIVTDPFARQKALNKAERNALRKLIPEFVAQTLIAAFLGDAARVQQIKVGADAQGVAELPPPLADEKAVAQKQRARDLYTELQGHAPGGVAVKFPPGTFHAYLARAEHDHDRLEDFIKYVEGKLAEAKALTA